MKIGYARVSTYEQPLDLQIDQLQAAGCDPDHIYADKEGVEFESGTGTPGPRLGAGLRAGGQPAGDLAA